MPRLIIMRGLPGSGKTTLALTLVDDPALICSAEDYRYVDGIYVYDRKMNKEVFRKCLEKAEFLMEDDEEFDVVIDNCNITRWAMRPYLVLAERYEYDVRFVRSNTQWQYNPRECYQKCMERGTRVPPLDSIKQMLRRME